MDSKSLIYDGLQIRQFLDLIKNCDRVVICAKGFVELGL
jgi:hypothetical protein